MPRLWKYEAVMFTQRTDTVVSRRIVLHADGTIAGGYQGRWKMFGSRYITLEIGKNVYSGVVMPAWMDGQHVAGLTVTAMGSPCGMSHAVRRGYFLQTDCFENNFLKKACFLQKERKLGKKIKIFFKKS